MYIGSFYTLSYNLVWGYLFWFSTWSFFDHWKRFRFDFYFHLIHPKPCATVRLFMASTAAYMYSNFWLVMHIKWNKFTNLAHIYIYIYIYIEREREREREFLLFLNMQFPVKTTYQSYLGQFLFFQTPFTEDTSYICNIHLYCFTFIFRFFSHGLQPSCVFFFFPFFF